MTRRVLNGERGRASESLEGEGEEKGQENRMNIRGIASMVKVKMVKCNVYATQHVYLVICTH